MLQLKTPLSPAESDLLLKCLSDMENDLRDRRTCSKQDLAKQTTIASAKQKSHLTSMTAFIEMKSRTWSLLWTLSRENTVNS